MSEPILDDLIHASLQQSPELHVHMLAQACIRRDQRIAELSEARRVVPDITDEDISSVSVLMLENGIGCHDEENEDFRRIVAATWAYAQGATVPDKVVVPEPNSDEWKAIAANAQSADLVDFLSGAAAYGLWLRGKIPQSIPANRLLKDGEDAISGDLVAAYRQLHAWAMMVGYEGVVMERLEDLGAIPFGTAQAKGEDA